MAARRAAQRKVRPPVAEPAPWQTRSPPLPPLASLGSVPALPIVQRQCDECGSEEEEKRSPAIQPRLRIGAVDDPLEREADSVADRVMRMPGPAGSPPVLSPADELLVARKASGAGEGGDFGAALGGGGSPLAPEARGFLEPRFGRDLGHVRIHADARAGALAESIDARAFTHGADIYFRGGEYDPQSGEGRRLLAHEVAHTFQQGEGGAAPDVQRAVVRYGNINVTVNYGPVINVPPADLAGRVLAAIGSYTGAVATPAQDTAVRALNGLAQNWLLFALQLLIDNAAAAPGLVRADAVDRLIAQAAVSNTAPLPDPDDAFVHEALSVSGWLQRALANPLTAPTGTDATAINTLLHPPPTTGSASDPLDEPQLRRRLTAGLTFLFNRFDPGRWPATGRRSITTFRALGDIIHDEARTFFAPYADAAIGNLYSLTPRWRPSAQISATETIVPDAARRRGYVRNRANIVGGNTTVRGHLPDTNIFADCHYDAQRDSAAFEMIVRDVAADATLQPIIDRLIQHTGFQRGDGAASQIGLVMEYNAGRINECQAQWEEIDTLCHEVLHALAHPDFHNSASRTDRPLVVTEGFTEVLGNQLFNDWVIPKAARDRPFKDMLEAGVTGAPCPAPTAGTIGYGDNGAAAEDIRTRVHDDNFRAAYFLGRPELAGIR